MTATKISNWFLKMSSEKIGHTAQAEHPRLSGNFVITLVRSVLQLPYDEVPVQGGLLQLPILDDRAWYPLGRIIGRTIYPGLMLTLSLLHYVMNFLNVTIHIREVCFFLAPLFSSLTVVVTYHLTKELKDVGAGLVAAFPHLHRARIHLPFRRRFL